MIELIDLPGRAQDRSSLRNRRFVYSRPVRRRMSRMITTRPSPPLGP
jgi:hypothetical protein